MATSTHSGHVSIREVHCHWRHHASMEVHRKATDKVTGCRWTFKPESSAKATNHCLTRGFGWFIYRLDCINDVPCPHTHAPDKLCARWACKVACVDRSKPVLGIDSSAERAHLDCAELWVHRLKWRRWVRNPPVFTGTNIEEKGSTLATQCRIPTKGQVSSNRLLAQGRQPCPCCRSSSNCSRSARRVDAQC